MNDEQRARAREMDRLNLFLEGILGNLGVGVAVLDEEQRVQIWNESAFELWGLRAEEVEGHHLQSLDMGMPLDALWEPIRLALGDAARSSEVVLDAVNRRGRTFRCEVRVLPLVSPQGRRYGAIMLMSEQDG
jgi:two-component system CheB/CheR fusion protein